MNSLANGSVTPADFATSLLSELSNIGKENLKKSNGHITDLPPDARPYLLTLHVLFPHCLLDALDLIDRGLVHICDVKPLLSEDNDGVDLSKHSTVYHVCSAQTIAAPDWNPNSSTSFKSSMSSNSNKSKSYQVHLHAWHCSCPAFAFAAFSNISRLDHSVHCKRLTKSENGFKFGGTECTGWFNGSSPSLPPVCKHLMACVLLENCQRLFPQSGNRVEGLRRLISLQKAAGWARGADID